jgi:tetratricopeptide (TPR) repeat protein
MQSARKASLAALRLDPLDPEAHLLRSRIALQHDWDWPAAEAHARRALELAPGVAEALLVQATWAISLGRTAEALELAREAKVLDPLSSVVAGDLAAFYFWSDDPLQVLRETAALLELEAETPVALALRLDALFELERWDEARTLALRLVGEPRGLESASGEEVERSFLAGQHEAWLAVPESDERSMVLASVAARLGHRDEAIEHLQRAVELHCAYVPFLPIDPHLASLRGDTRFAAILEEVGHPLSSRPGGPVELAVGRHGTS